MILRKLRIIFGDSKQRKFDKFTIRFVSSQGRIDAITERKGKGHIIVVFPQQPLNFEVFF